MSNTLLIDCTVSGISGDMLLAALLDLGADEQGVARTIESIPSYLEGCKSLKLRSERLRADGILGRRVLLEYEDEIHGRPGKVLMRATRTCLEAEGISGWPFEVAMGALDTLCRAEAAVHGVSPEDVVLHEVGEADTVADMIGVAVALQSLGVKKGCVLVTHMAVGGGYIPTHYGTLSVPAPVTLELLRMAGIPFHGGPTEGELATPTGVSLLLSLSAKPVRFYPPMVVRKVGYGVGTKPHEGRFSVLRCILADGRPYVAEGAVAVLETNVDDVTGEILSNTVERLMSAGALDVHVIPAMGKKGRPSSMVRALVKTGSELEIARVMMEELGTLGVRFHKVDRLVAERETSEVGVKISGKEYRVRVKRSYLPDGRPLAVKPEFEDILRISSETGMPSRIVLEVVKREISGQ